MKDNEIYFLGFCCFFSGLYFEIVCFFFVWIDVEWLIRMWKEIVGKGLLENCCDCGN